MNVKFLSKVFAKIIVAMLLISLNSCHDDGVPAGSFNNPSDQGFVVNSNPLLSKCQLPVYFGKLSTVDESLQHVFRNRFPNSTSVEQAKVAFVDPYECLTIDDDLIDFYERGGLIVVLRPTDQNYHVLPESIKDDDFNDNEQLEELFFAFNKFEQHYTMIDEPKFSGMYNLVERNDEQMRLSDEYGQQNPPEEIQLPVHEIDNQPEQNIDYWQTRLTPFVDWLDEMTQLQTVRMNAVKKDGELPDYKSLKADISNEGLLFETNFPFSLNNVITSGVSEDWSLNKNSSISVRYTIYPVYMLSCNGNNAGDYYIVTGKVTPHNNSMWGPMEKSGGLFNMGRCRIYGYWFKSMDVAFDLLDGNNMVDGLRYQQTPIPENENSEVDYSKGFSASINGSVSGGWSSKLGLYGEAKVGFSVGWESKTNYSLKTIAYSRDSSTPTVKYNYYTNNVKLTDNGIDNLNENFPAACRQEFDANNVWVWHVPAGRAGVKDNSDKKFSIRVKVKANYSSWYHWRGAVEYDSNRADYATNDFSYTMELQAPNRQPWGIIALKNAAKRYTVRNIKIYKDGKESGDVVATIPSTYEYNEMGYATLGEGKYTVTFEYCDPNQNNKVMGIGKITGVNVKAGRSAEEATTEISTADASISN